jgi:exonuclease III
MEIDINFMGELRIISYNVRGIGEAKKRNCVFNFLKTNYNDIIYLQETHSVEKIEQKWTREWGGHTYFAHGTSGSKGVAIFISRKINHAVNDQIADPNGRYLLLNITIEDENYILFYHYAPTKTNLRNRCNI